MPDELQEEVKLMVNKLKKLKSKEAVLAEAYSVITSRYEARRSKTVLRLLDTFSASSQDLWNRSGFMHCTNQNYLLALLLVKSKVFTEADIKRRWALYWGISPHQYLQVRLKGDNYINVDAWSAAYGIKLGDYSRWFHTSDKSEE